MQLHRTIVGLSFLVVCLLTSPAPSQALKEEATESPLSTAFYLLSASENDDHLQEKACLANSLAGVGRYEDAFTVSKMAKEYSYTGSSYILLAEKLIKTGDLRRANDFVSYLVTRDVQLDGLLDVLVTLNRTNEALRIADAFDTSDRIDAYLEIAKQQLKQNLGAEALQTAQAISAAVEASPYDVDRSRLSLIYAQTGEGTLSRRLAQSSLRNVKWTTGIPDRDDSRIIDYATQTYLALGDYAAVYEILAKLGKAQDTRALIEIGESHLKRDDRKAALEIFDDAERLLSPKDYNSSFDLGRLVDIYLTVDVNKALAIAKNISGSEHMRQKSLMQIVDYYIDHRQPAKAGELLAIALNFTKSIDISEPENGLLSTSKKWEQAQYQTAIARRYIRIHSDVRALQIVEEIKKPCLKALLLTEYTDSAAKRISHVKLEPLLNKALSLLQNGKEEIFDTNKYDTYAKVARAFAVLGNAAKSGSIFAEVLSKDQEMYDRGLDGYLLTELCNIGVEYENSRINTNAVKLALKNIIDKWESDSY